MDNIHSKEGYSTRLRLNEDELGQLRQMIQMQWLYRLQLLIPESVQYFDQLGIKYYHLASHLINHEEVWPKTSRVFPREAVAIIRNMNFFKTLQKMLGNIIISDEENFGWENIYWRLVRPGSSDFGSLHADKWFWDLGQYGQFLDFPHERLKVWIAIYTIAGKNGLCIVPNSHLKKDWKWHVEERSGRKKPIFDDELSGHFKCVLLPLESGQSVIFHDELLHGGAVNLAETTRVSIEFTMLIPT
ncbi:MAG TPA: phytanoyl-CoA dioxygenase family protein [Gammaproteobacteria bacterium]|nr:phytanoyl-CoA dioxygenase family protein [Gammaproteobacteria bacterium]